MDIAWSLIVDIVQSGVLSESGIKHFFGTLSGHFRDTFGTLAAHFRSRSSWGKRGHSSPIQSRTHPLTRAHAHTRTRPPQVEVFVAGGRATAVGRDYPAAGETTVHLANGGAEPLLVKQLDIYAMGCGWL